jgi:hypothetical protein
MRRTHMHHSAAYRPEHAPTATLDRVCEPMEPVHEREHGYGINDELEDSDHTLL